MPSAAAKKKQAAQRVAQFKVSKDTGSDDQQLENDIAVFNDKQQQINADREDLLKRMTARSVKSSMDALGQHSKAAEMSERKVRHNEAASTSEHQVQNKSHDDVAQSRPPGAQLQLADRPSQSGVTCTESCRQQAHPMQLLQSTYPQRLKMASTKAVEELLDLLHLYEPPSDPDGRKQFEAQIYVKVKRILRNQRQRAYRKAKKEGYL